MTVLLVDRNQVFAAMDVTRIVEVALNTAVLRTMDGHAVATAFLGAARAAQDRATVWRASPRVIAS